MPPFCPPPLADPLAGLTRQALAIGWLGQLLLAALLSQWLPIPTRPLLIDRSACSAPQWQGLLRRYSALHLQDRLGQQRFSPVVQTSVLGEQLTAQPPSPQRLAATPSVGVRDAGRIAALKGRYPTAITLTCLPPETTLFPRAESEP